MTHWNQEFFLLYTVSTAVSGVCSVVLCLGLLCSKLHRASNHFHLVLFMALCDLLLGARHLIQFFNDHPTIDSTPRLCLLSAWLGTFSIVATSSWYFVIAVAIFNALSGRRLPGTTSSPCTKLAQHCYVWGLSVGCATVPLVGRAYGEMPDDGTCWIKPAFRPQRLVVVVPLGLYLGFALFLFFYCCLRGQVILRFTKHRHSLMVVRMVSFVTVFLLTWSWPFSYELCNLMGRPLRGVVFRYLDIIAISGSGTWNFLVWIAPPLVRSLCCPKGPPMGYEEEYEAIEEQQVREARRARRVVRRAQQSGDMLHPPLDRDSTASGKISVWRRSRSSNNASRPRNHSATEAGATGRRPSRSASHSRSRSHTHTRSSGGDGHRHRKYSEHQGAQKSKRSGRKSNARNDLRNTLGEGSTKNKGAGQPSNRNRESSRRANLANNDLCETSKSTNTLPFPAVSTAGNYVI